MERKHFVTVSQKVFTRVITISVKKVGKKNKLKKYSYMIVKLPSTFKEQKVELWNNRTKKGKTTVAKLHGGAGIVRFEPIDKDNFKKGDIVTASFIDSSAELV